MADLFCESSIPDYQQEECGVELGGIIAIGIIHPSEVEDIDTDDVSGTLESESWWTNNINASPSTVWVIKNTRGSKAAGTPVEEEGFGLVPMERTGDDKELAGESLWVMANRNFWAKVNRTRNLGFVYVTAGKDANGNYNAFYAPNASVYGDTVIEQSIKSRMRTSFNAKWSSALTPDLPFAAPASVFVD
jgi:hypothetical protein